MTMAYIVFVNPAILSETGMPAAAVVASTCLSAAFGSILMGVAARYPIALVPGMGLNAYFTYTLLKGMGVPWQVALGAVFLSGVAFVILTVLGICKLIVQSIPSELYAAVAAGIGLFIAFIGFRNSGIIVPSPATTVALGNLRDPHTALALLGLIGTSAMLVRGWRAAMLMGVVGTALLGVVLGLVTWHPQTYGIAEITATAFQLDVLGALRLGGIEIIFVFLFVDLFDNVGPLVAVGEKANLFDRANQIPRIDRILLTDATATIAGSLAGTSTVVSYIESPAGVVAGGRSGVTSIVTGLLFLAALFVAPLLGLIPNAATAPVLIPIWRHDAVTHRGDRLERACGCHPGFSDHHRHSAHVQRCQRACVRLHCVHATADRKWGVPSGALAHVHPDRSLPPALLVSRRRLKGQKIRAACGWKPVRPRRPTHLP